MKRPLFKALWIGAVLALAGAAAGQEVAAPLPASPKDICPLLVGEEVPAIELQTAEGQSFDLAAALVARPAILVFYRGGW